MTVSEPPRPERGRTADERPRDVSEAQLAVEAAPTWTGKIMALAHPRFWFSMAEGYPVGLKQFLQLGLLISYPAWLFVVVLYGPLWVVGKILEWILWVLFWPVRAMHKKNNPEEYAAFQAEQKAKKDARKAADAAYRESRRAKRS